MSDDTDIEAPDPAAVVVVLDHHDEVEVAHAVHVADDLHAAAPGQAPGQPGQRA